MLVAMASCLAPVEQTASPLGVLQVAQLGQEKSYYVLRGNGDSWKAKGFRTWRPPLKFDSSLVIPLFVEKDKRTIHLQTTTYSSSRLHIFAYSFSRKLVLALFYR